MAGTYNVSEKGGGGGRDGGREVEREVEGWRYVGNIKEIITRCDNNK